METLKNLWAKYKSFFLIFLFCASIIFYLSRRVITIDNQLVKLQMELIQKDTLLKITEGKYRKVVNTYTSPKDLKEIVRKNSGEISKIIINNKEKVLSNTNVNLTFKGKMDTIFVTKKDSLYTFSSFYPKSPDPFIQFDGVLNTNNNKLTENWKFNDVKLNIVLTEKENGLWNTYLDAPEYVKVNSMTINSLPPKEYTPKAEKAKLFNLYGGLGVRSGINTLKNFKDKDITVNGAITIKNKVMVQLNYGTDNKIGTGFLVKF